MQARTVLLIVVPENILCLIKMLLVIAIRTGTVKSRSVEALIASISAHKDKTVQSAHGKRAVIASIGTSGRCLELEEPADNNQITNSIARAGQLFGIISPLMSHDLRRGGPKDLMQVDMESGNKGVANYAIASHLVHSRLTFSKGVTDRYTGNTGNEVWSKRTAIPDD